MTTLQATTNSPEVLFDAPSTSSLELSFSPPQATSSDLHEDSKTSTHAIDEAEGAAQNTTNGDINEVDADKTSSKELEGLRSVNLTPTSPSSEATHTNADAAPETNEGRTSSPPIVLKSVPGSPSAEKTRLNDLMESTSATPSYDANAKRVPNGTEDDLDDPQALVISSLRTQISDLFSQVNLLNSKLVQSYDRVSTLEETLDDNTERLHALEGERMNLEREKSVLELERAKQEQMLKDGRLIERSAVATELSRLMEESVASSSAKLSAEAKHKQMESELSELSANLFSTANEMVATERQARAQAEESLVSTRATAAALEKQLEAAKAELNREENEKEVLRGAKARTEQEMVELRRAMRGVNSSNMVSLGSGGVLRMMNSHLPYKNEYLGFLAHLRGLAGGTPNIPAITSLLALPFLARLAVEDSEPTLRLDLAPSLNWLTRRSVLAAIHSNTLLIEQIHVATLFLEGSSSSYSYVGFGSGSSLPTSPTQLTKVNCALCGKVVYMSPEAIQAEENRNQSTFVISESPTAPAPHSIPTSSTAPSPQRTGSGSGWAASKFLKSVTLPSLGGVVAAANGSRSSSPTPRHSLDSTTVNGSGPTTPITITHERPSSPPPPTSLQTVIHAFRVPLSGKSAGGSTSNLPASAIDSSQRSETYGPPYPLCHTGWCLARLKTTCELWGCVKTDIIERAWKDGAVERRRLGSGSSAEIGDVGSANMEKALPPIGSDSNSGPATKDSAALALPPKRKMADLWGMGKDVLDKAKAYGNNSPGADKNSPSTSPVSTTGGASSFFGGVRRTFSGSAIMTTSTTPTESIRDRSSLSEGLVKAVDLTGTVKAPALPKRNTSRLSAVFTGPLEGAGSTKKDDVEGRNAAAPLESEEVEGIHNDSLVLPVSTPDELTLREATLDPSATADTFVTPSETPNQERSPNPNAQERKDGASAEALSTAISDHLSRSTEGGTEAAMAPTPIPSSIGFSTSQTAPSDATVPTSPKAPPLPRTGHARNTSIASIIGEGRGTKTPRPTTPVKRPGSASMSPTRQANFQSGSRPGTPTKAAATSGSRPGTPNKTSGTSGSRPSTPSKLATLTPSKPDNPSSKPGSVAPPPPVPRRAAARNAARTSAVGAPKEEEKPARTSLEGVPESVGSNRDVTKDGDAREEKAGSAQEEKGEASERAEEGSEATPTGDEVTPAQDEPSMEGDITIITGNSLDDAEVVALTLDIAPPTPSSADKEDAARNEAIGHHEPVNTASATSPPKSFSLPLPASPTSHPVPPLPPSLEGPPSAYANSTRPRRPSVVSTSSVYSPSVYTTNSGVNGPTVGAVGGLSANSEEHTGRHGGEAARFYVGRETWEERAWLQLVQIRESMFWARLGGVRY